MFHIWQLNLVGTTNDVFKRTKLPIFFQRFWTKVGARRVKKAKIGTENGFTWDQFKTYGSRESSNDKKNAVLGISVNLHRSCNP